MSTQTHETRTTVRDHYAKIAQQGGSCAPGCCGGATSTPELSLRLGYSAAR